jgi:hypothetical protein
MGSGMSPVSACRERHRRAVGGICERKLVHIWRMMVHMPSAVPVRLPRCPPGALPIDRGVDARRRNHICMYGRPAGTKRRFRRLRFSGRVSVQEASNRGTQVGRPRRQAPVGSCSNRRVRARLIPRPQTASVCRTDARKNDGILNDKSVATRLTLDGSNSVAPTQSNPRSC